MSLNSYTPQWKFETHPELNCKLVLAPNGKWKFESKFKPELNLTAPASLPQWPHEQRESLEELDSSSAWESLEWAPDSKVRCGGLGDVFVDPLLRFSYAYVHGWFFRRCCSGVWTVFITLKGVWPLMRDASGSESRREGIENPYDALFFLFSIFLHPLVLYLLWVFWLKGWGRFRTRFGRVGSVMLIVKRFYRRKLKMVLEVG